MDTQQQDYQEERCYQLLMALCREQDWGLNQEEERRYLTTILRLVSVDSTDSQIMRTFKNYHLDHAQIDELSNHRHPNHNEAWSALQEIIMGALRHSGLSWTRDPAYDVKDLVQMAYLEVSHSLPSFRYASRATTWIYQICVQRIRRFLRDQHAEKRRGSPDSLEDMGEPPALISEYEHPDTEAETRAFHELIIEILSRQPDPRLARIFRLWLIEDMRIEDIGKQVDLAPSRIRALLAQARKILQSDPRIRSWYKDIDAG